MNNSLRIKVLSYFTVAEKFLNLTRLAAQKIVEYDNRFIVPSEHPLTVEAYNKDTEWSDHSISIPILFNFYHGIELILKGIISALGEDNVKKTHKLTQLIEIIDGDTDSANLVNLIKKWTINLEDSCLFKKFLIQNNVEIDSWYEILKYPLKGKGEDFILHYQLKYQADAGLVFWDAISKASVELIFESYEFFHLLEEKE